MPQLRIQFNADVSAQGFLFRGNLKDLLSDNVHLKCILACTRQMFKDIGVLRRMAEKAVIEARKSAEAGGPVPGSMRIFEILAT